MPPKRSAITEDDFFYVSQDNYDEHIELAIPFYRPMHKELTRLVPAQGLTKVLDLGCGTGKTAAVFLRECPGVRVRAIDLFETMLKHARARLESFEGQVEYVQGDFREVDLGKDYDVCVSALAIHHSPSEDKKKLLSRICQSLAPQGRFLMIDWTRFDSPAIQAAAAEFAEEHARSCVPDQSIALEWMDHWRTKNLPETVEDLLLWMRQAGFSHAECVMRYYGLALICAER